MVHTGIFATQSEIATRAGKNVSISGSTEIVINDFAKQSESIINTLTRRNWSDDYAAANEDVKRILSAASSAYCAKLMVPVDMSTYTTRVEAENIVSINRDDFLFLMNILLDQKAEDFMDAEKDT